MKKREKIPLNNKHIFAFSTTKYYIFHLESPVLLANCLSFIESVKGVSVI